ncbi:MAG: hypothetical protein ACD_45C00448G0001 [uncultured bacterium]|nr:MAG: hypothetical protein ACD_45C00448G0001 [uncultured bacterium]
MKKSLTVVSTVALAVCLGFASSAMAQTPTVPYLYVYSVVGATPGGLAKATLIAAQAGSGSTVGLPPTMPYAALPNAGSPLVVYNGKQNGPVSAKLTYQLSIPVNGGQNSTCVYSVSSPNVGFKTGANAKAKLVSDSGGMNLCNMFTVPVYTNNSQDGDQVITMNFKPSF